jgi:hypothetical protein
MPRHASGWDRATALGEAVGYLNFSSGSPDPQFLGHLNRLWQEVESDPRARDRVPAVLATWLQERLLELEHEGGTFSDVSQARGVIQLALIDFPPRYRDHHRDLLFHQRDRDLWRPLLFGRVFAAILLEGPPWDESDRIVAGAIARLNDYVGYRPVAALEGTGKMAPRPHEAVRPVPLYIDGFGVGEGPYARLSDQALAILRQTDSDLLARAWFDPNQVTEVALDPRAYDFDHPVNRRPNYQFGQWDPHVIDQKGFYRRFVLQQVTLDALLARVEQDCGHLPPDELLTEAAAVLAGTILMASGISGSGPDTHDSSVSLATLIGYIAAYRDEFYQRLVERLPQGHARRLRHESDTFKQPLGAARQHLNQTLAERRAAQLQHVHLAMIYARMGYPEAAIREAHAVPVTAARLLTRIFCGLTAIDHAVDAGQLDEVPDLVAGIDDLLQRAIACGAVVDPWNVVGFGGNFALFPALENSIHDYRVDVLIDLMTRLLAAIGRGWTVAAADQRPAVETRMAALFGRLARWWDQFATASVSGVQRLVGGEMLAATEAAAEALQAWCTAGAAAGDITFWRDKVGRFLSPKAFHLVIEALLIKGDHVTSMALLMQWLSQADTTPLVDGDSSLHHLAQRWLYAVARADLPLADRWALMRRFFEYLEANGESYWEVPEFESDGRSQQGTARDWDHEPDDLDDLPPEDDADEEETLYSAAYEQVVYRDSTNDGVDGDVLGDEPFAATEDLKEKAGQLIERLRFLENLAGLWRQTAILLAGEGDLAEDQRQVLADWRQLAQARSEQLLRLLEITNDYSISVPTGSPQSLLEYDRRRMTKEGLLDRILSTCIAMASAQQYLAAAAGRDGHDTAVPVALLGSLLAGDAVRVRTLWRELLETLRDRPLLYVPLARGGRPHEVVAARVNRCFLQDLLVALPRLGLLVETRQLLETALAMELEHPVGPTAVTEFDRLFVAAMQGVVECVMASAGGDNAAGQPVSPSTLRSDHALVGCLQRLAESYLRLWLRHSRRMRLAAVEKVMAQKPWEELVIFIARYGHDLFTQQFLALGNARAILLQGVEAWLEQAAAAEPDQQPLRLIEELGGAIGHNEAVSHLTVALESVVENNAAFRDFNTTTTQSDRGELLAGFIDFVRLRAGYDRVAWNLRPLVIIHAVMVRAGRSEAATQWRSAMAERTKEAADGFALRLGQISKTYGMRLLTISDRIAERFVRPLTVDQIRALVRPAVDAARQGQGEDNPHLSALATAIEELARTSTGAGLDLPEWLEALEEELDIVETSDQVVDLRDATAAHVLPQVVLPWSDIRRQLAKIRAAKKRKKHE